MERTANQNVKPLTCKRDENGELQIGGCKISKLIKDFGSPLYIYDYETIHSVIKDLKKAFNNTNIHIMYASKAFMTKAVCKIMQKENCGLDCVSSGELYTAYISDFDMQNVIFNGNNKTKEEIDMAVKWGVKLFSVDNFLEAKFLNDICKNKSIKMDILLRITPGIECHTHEYIQTGHLDSKFGFDLIQIDSIINLIKNEYQNLNLRGLHAHLGSQIFQTDVYRDCIKIILKEAKRIKNEYGLTLDIFNIGGGIGIKYVETDKPLSLFDFAKTIKEALKKYSEEYDIKNSHLYIEPGRCIVGTAGVTVYTIGSSKQVPNGRKYISVDGGMADNIRPALYGADYSVDLVKQCSQEQETVTIAGRYCESGDILIKDVNLPKIKHGDLICFYDTGAYCYSMASNYNRVLKPAVVMVKEGNAELIVKRQSFEELTESDVIPEMLK
ncbi:diaminopimelate decarboxylase [bacterium]|nr:diaminopimelate decarboxylase [bacterium]